MPTAAFCQGTPFVMAEYDSHRPQWLGSMLFPLVSLTRLAAWEKLASPSSEASVATDTSGGLSLATRLLKPWEAYTSYRGSVTAIIWKADSVRMNVSEEPHVRQLLERWWWEGGLLLVIMQSRFRITINDGYPRGLIAEQQEQASWARWQGLDFKPQCTAWVWQNQNVTMALFLWSQLRSSSPQSIIAPLISEFKFCSFLFSLLQRIWIVLSSVWKQALLGWWTNYNHRVLWPGTKWVERDGAHDGEEDGVRGCHHEWVHLRHRRVLLLKGDVSPEHWEIRPRS